MSDSDNPLPDRNDPHEPKQASSVPSPILIGTIAGVILAVAFGIAILRRGGDNTSAPATLGGAGPLGVGQGETGEPSILAPIGRVPHGALTLHWQTIKGFEEYEAQIYDSSGSLLWRSGRVRGESMNLPETAIKQLAPGPTHFWKVVAYGSGGREAASPAVPLVFTP